MLNNDGDFEVLYKDFNKNLNCFINKKQVENKTKVDLSKVKDYSIFQIFYNEIRKNKREYKYSSILKQKMADISKFNLPKNYCIIHAYTLADFRGTNERNLSLEFLNKIFSQNQNKKFIIVNNIILEQYNSLFSKYKNVINLTGKTSVFETFEILKSANEYIGADSFLSILATKLFPDEKIFVKKYDTSFNLNKTKDIYFYPKKNFNFIKDEY